jgi:hypothetical protein
MNVMIFSCSHNKRRLMNSMSSACAVVAMMVRRRSPAGELPVRPGAAEPGGRRAVLDEHDDGERGGGAEDERHRLPGRGLRDDGLPRHR